MSKQNDLMNEMSISQLCEAFELTNDPTVRGWIMDELETRNADSFNNWMETENVEMMDFPSKFFAA